MSPVWVPGIQIFMSVPFECDAGGPLKSIGLEHTNITCFIKRSYDLQSQEDTILIVCCFELNLLVYLYHSVGSI